MSGSDSPTSGSYSSSPQKHIHVVAGVVRHGDRILVARRKPGGPSGLRWEFAGGKVEPNEAPRDALAREMREELALEVTVLDEIGTFATVQGTVVIQLQCFWCSAGCSDVSLNEHVEARWLRLDQLGELDWAEPDVPVVNALNAL